MSIWSLSKKSRVSASTKEELFDSIYTSYFRLCVFYARQYLGDEELAKEIAQDTFLTVWERIDAIDLSHNVKAYLLTITRNKCLNLLRKRRNGKVVTDYMQKRMDEVNEQALADASADECLSFEINEMLDKALDDMPQQMRLSFCMNRYDHFTSDQIAEQMHISPRTVENKIYKATVILKKKFEDYK